MSDDRPMSSLQRLALDSVTSYLRFGVMMVVQFALVPMLIHHVGRDGYGLWTLTYAVLGVLSLADLGFTTTVVKFVGEARGSGDTERRNRILSTVTLVYLGLAALSSAGLWLGSTLYPEAMGIPPGTRDLSLALLWIVGARWIVVSLPFGVYRSILFGDGQITLVNAIQAGGSLLYGLMAWGALSTGLGLTGVAWASLGSFAVEHAGYLWAAYGRVEGLRISWRLVDRRLVWETGSVSLSQFLVSVSGLVLVRTDPVIVKVFLPLSAVALYGVALKVAENALVLLKQAVNALAPPIARWKGSGDDAKIRGVLVSGAKFTFAPAALLAVAAWALGREGLVYWAGPEFLDATLLLRVLVTAMALTVPQMVASVVFTMSGDHRITAWASVASMVVNLTASVLLVQRMGLVGVALGTLVAALLVDTGVIVVLIRRRHGVGYGEFLTRVYASCAWPAAAAFAAMKGLALLLPPPNLVAVAAEGLVGTAVYALVFWAAGLAGDERLLLRDLVRGIARRAARNAEASPAA